MKVFLSWSGDTSHKIALALYGWLPMVIQRIEPYISSEIEKGTRWSTDIARELEHSAYGIACVTDQNKEASWLLFEAGALSKSVAEGRMAPLLCGIEHSDIQKSPISQFQLTKFEVSEFRRLLHSINSNLGTESLEASFLDNLFDALWPRLITQVETILGNAAPAKPASPPTADGDRIMGAIEELLTNSRATAQILSRPERFLPEQYLRHAIRYPGYDRHLSGREVRQLGDLTTRARSSLGDVQVDADDDRALVDETLETLNEIASLLREAIRSRNIRSHEIEVSDYPSQESLFKTDDPRYP